MVRDSSQTLTPAVQPRQNNVSRAYLIDQPAILDIFTSIEIRSTPAAMRLGRGGKHLGDTLNRTPLVDAAPRRYAGHGDRVCRADPVTSGGRSSDSNLPRLQPGRILSDDRLPDLFLLGPAPH
jgi:hypothetical protein